MSRLGEARDHGACAFACRIEAGDGACGLIVDIEHAAIPGQRRAKCTRACREARQGLERCAVDLYDFSQAAIGDIEDLAVRRENNVARRDEGAQHAANCVAFEVVRDHFGALAVRRHSHALVRT